MMRQNNSDPGKILNVTLSFFQENIFKQFECLSVVPDDQGVYCLSVDLQNLMYLEAGNLGYSRSYFVVRRSRGKRGVNQLE